MKTIIARGASVIAASLIALAAGAQVTQPTLKPLTTPAKITPESTLATPLAQSSVMVEFGSVSFPALKWSTGLPQASAATGAGGLGKAMPSDVVIVKVVDAASPQLARMAATRQRATLTLTASKGGASEQFVFSDAVLTSATLVGGQGQPQQQQLTFVYYGGKKVYP